MNEGDEGGCDEGGSMGWVELVLKGGEGWVGVTSARW